MRNKMLDCADDANLFCVVDLRYADDSAWNDLVFVADDEPVKDAKETWLEFRQRCQLARVNRGRKNDRLVFQVEEKLATMTAIMPSHEDKDENVAVQNEFLAKLDSLGWSLLSLASAAVLSDCRTILEYGITADQYASGDF